MDLFLFNFARFRGKVIVKVIFNGTSDVIYYFVDKVISNGNPLRLSLNNFVIVFHYIFQLTHTSLVAR